MPQQLCLAPRVFVMRVALACGALRCVLTAFGAGANRTADQQHHTNGPNGREVADRPTVQRNRALDSNAESAQQKQATRYINRNTT